MLYYTDLEGEILIIDRIEEEIAVCEMPDGTMKNIHLNELPKGIKEGDVMRVKAGKLYIDMDEYERRKKEIEDMMKDFF